MSDTIQAETRTQVSGIEADIDVAVVSAQSEDGVPWADMREIRDSTAVTIAAQWQSPGSVGRVLASLASGCAVDVGELLEDISRTLDEARTERDRDALGCLATWAMNHPSRH